VLIEYASKTKAIRDIILRTMANLLGLGDDYFANRITSKALALARLGYYPPCPRPDLVLGFKPHCDGGALSILFIEENTCGLQIMKDGKWYDVLCEPYTLLINIGECMEVGIYKGYIHSLIASSLELQSWNTLVLNHYKILDAGNE
jgi:isopenicillin N synthase-like dioxygenase